MREPLDVHQCGALADRLFHGRIGKVDDQRSGLTETDNLDGVDPRPAVDLVCSFRITDDQVIVAGATVDDVDTEIALKMVVAAIAIERIVAAIAAEIVDQSAAGDGVLARAADIAKAAPR